MIAALAALFRARFEADLDTWLDALESQGRAYGPARGPDDADEANEVLLPDDAGRWPLWWSFNFGKDVGALPAVPSATTVDYLGWTGFRARPDEVAAVLRANVEARAEAFAIDLAAVIEDLVHDDELRAAMLPCLRPVVDLWPGCPDDQPVDELWRQIEATPFRRFRLSGNRFRIPADLSETDLSAWIAGARTLPRGNGDVDGHSVDQVALMWIWDAERAVRRERAARRDRSAVFVSAEALAALREMVEPVDAGPAFAAAVREALANEARDGNPLANSAASSARQVAEWALDLLTEARDFAGRLTAPTTEDEARELVDGMMPWDAAIVRRLEELDGDLASDLRNLRAAKAEAPPRALWAFWTSPAEGPPFWLLWLAGGLFRSMWGPDLLKGQRLAALRPAVTVRTMRAAGHALSPTTAAMPDEHGITLITASGDHAGRLELDALTRDLFAWRGSVVPADEARRVANELVKARSTTAAVFTFLHAIHTVNELSRQGLAHRATWGSWNLWVEEVADAYEVKPTPDLRRLLCAAAWFGNAVQVPLFDGRTQKGLWTLTAPDPFKRGRPDPQSKRSTKVEFGYAPILAPEWTTMENSDDRNRGVRLMAIPKKMPVGVRNPAIRGALYLFTLDLLAEVTMASNPDRGLVVLPDRLEALGRAHGLPVAYTHAQNEAMQNEGLTERIGGRYRLADPDARRLSAPRFVRNKTGRT